MADLATPAAADMSTSTPTPTTNKTKAPVAKPEKPDDEQYKKDVAQAEKEHGASQDTLVCDPPKNLHPCAVYQCCLYKAEKYLSQTLLTTTS